MPDIDGASGVSGPADSTLVVPVGTISQESGPTGPLGPSAPEQLFHIIAYHESWHGLVVKQAKTKPEAIAAIRDIMKDHDPDTWQDISIRLICGVELGACKPRTAVVVDIDASQEVLFTDKPA